MVETELHAEFKKRALEFAHDALIDDDLSHVVIHNQRLYSDLLTRVMKGEIDTAELYKFTRLNRQFNMQLEADQSWTINCIDEHDKPVKRQMLGCFEAALTTLAAMRTVYQIVQEYKAQELSASLG